LTVQPHNVNEPFTARYGETTRNVYTDNYAQFLRTIIFSLRNRCEDLFFLRYRIRSEGFVGPIDVTEPNLAPVEDMSRYEDTGTEFTCAFAPKAKQDFRMDVEVYGGYGRGNRNIHFHFASLAESSDFTKRRLFHIKRLHFELDLRSYLAGGFSLSKPPMLFLYPHDVPDHSLCGERQHGEPLPSQDTASVGRWTWQIDSLRGGVLDLIWDLKEV
jgi:hypothetical protein